MEAPTQHTETGPASQAGPSSSQPFIVTPARGESDVACARSLIVAYTDWLDLDLSYQGLAAELASLPGKYSPEQGGEILLARSIREEDRDVEGSHDAKGRLILGIICLRRLAEDQYIKEAQASNGAVDPLLRGEVKRLYVVPQARGLGVGSSLIKSLMDMVIAAPDASPDPNDGDEAPRIPAYDELYLDTLPRMLGAIRSYTRAGFAPCHRYYDSPVGETLYFRWRRGDGPPR